MRLKPYFWGGGRVWAKARTITFDAEKSTWGDGLIREKNYVSGDKSLVANYPTALTVAFTADVTASKECLRGGFTAIEIGEIIPAGTGTQPKSPGLITFTEVV